MCVSSVTVKWNKNNDNEEEEEENNFAAATRPQNWAEKQQQNIIFCRIST